MINEITIILLICNLFLGMTSEGGGAVAFPVMTLLLKIEPGVARDFSLMVQSVGKILNRIFLIHSKYKLSLI